MTVAQEKRLLQLVFQLQYLMRERALGDKQLPGGSREVERLCQLREVFQLS